MDSTGDDLDTESGKACRVGFPGWAQAIGTTPWLKTSSGVRHGRVRRDAHGHDQPSPQTRDVTRSRGQLFKADAIDEAGCGGQDGPECHRRRWRRRRLRGSTRWGNWLVTRMAGRPVRTSTTSSRSRRSTSGSRTRPKPSRTRSRVFCSQSRNGGPAPVDPGPGEFLHQGPGDGGRRGVSRRGAFRSSQGHWTSRLDLGEGEEGVVTQPSQDPAPHREHSRRTPERRSSGNTGFGTAPTGADRSAAPGRWARLRTPSDGR